MLTALQDPVCIAVIEATQVGEARRALMSLTHVLKFDAQRAGQAAIVVTEAANNLVRHGGGGEIVLRTVQRASVNGIELLAIDKGPGISNMSQATRDGFSTGGTAGNGLGAIQRLSGDFDIYSNSEPAVGGTGTVLMSRWWNTSISPPPDELDSGVVCLPKPGEEASGDSWTIICDRERVLVVLADGLGHGLQAAEASRRAISIAQEYASYDPVRLMETIHGALRSTRGAAVAVVELFMLRGTVQMVGVGNIFAAVVGADGALRSMNSHNGTAGVEARRIQAFSYPWPAGSTLVMHSDGISAQWQMLRYPGLLRHSPSVIAGVLYRDHRRIRDDATVLVARQGRRA